MPSQSREEQGRPRGGVQLSPGSGEGQSHRETEVGRERVANQQTGPPTHIRSDNGSEFTAQAVRDWLRELGVKTLFIEPGSPWENGYIESFNGKLRDELLNGEIFYTIKEAEVLIEQWRWHYNHIRPHSSLGYRPPVPMAILPTASKMQAVAVS